MEAKAEKIVVAVGAMQCSACAVKIEKALYADVGVKKASVHLPSKTVFISFNPVLTSIDHIKQAIEGIGYKVLAVSQSGAPADALIMSAVSSEIKMYRNRFFGAFVISAVLMFSKQLELSQYSLWVLATIAWLWCGFHFHRGFIKTIKLRSADMNALVSMSVSSAYFYSVFVLFSGHSQDTPMWSEVSLLLMFINLGRWIEGGLKKNAGQSIAKLLSLAPRRARIADGGGEKIIPAEKVLAGQVVLVKPGEQIPVDGEIIEGSTSVEEAMLTGESLPAEKSVGSKVFAGTLNKNGAVAVLATDVGENMALARIISAVRESQAGKTRVQSAVDKVSAYFVPSVFFTAVFSGGLWYFFGGGIFAAVSVFTSALAVSCPCAMGLAIPMALMAGFDRAAGLGIVIRNGDVLAGAGELNVVVLDKTGTLTKGKISVTGAYPSKGHSGEELLKWALFAERKSEHPFAQAVQKYAGEKNITAPSPDGFEAFAGCGVKASLGWDKVLAGKIEWLAGEGVYIDTAQIKDEASSIIGVALNSEFLGYLLLSDTLKDSAKKAVEELKKINLEVILVSGDREGAVAKIAGEAQISRYYADVLPQDKAKIVAELQAEGKKVAFVGDGFNDAPAMAKADVGMAMASGVDVAIESADITLIRQDLSVIYQAVVLSSAIRKIIKQNLIWAFAYNIILIPFAAGLFYPIFKVMLMPRMAGIAMALSSISVVLNSLRLRKIAI
ncbi:MAG: heavy metal translocating P-type ATPase [Elusimicrobia bacterium]|nr:heavy metal translocating P-type ATPase [Elusimicrobiota bacterium]